MFFLKLIKVHISYLFNKKNIILTLIINFISIVYLFISSSVLNGYYVLDSNRSYYLSIYTGNFILFLRIFYIIYIFYASLTYFIKSYSNYSQFIIKDKKSLILFYITKYFSLLIVISIQYVLFILYYVLILILMPYSRYIFSITPVILKIYLISIIYLLISCYLLNKFNSNFASFLGFMLYFISFIMSYQTSDINVISKIFLVIFPNIVGDDYLLLYGYYHIIVLTILLIFINYLSIKKLDSY